MLWGSTMLYFDVDPLLMEDEPYEVRLLTADIPLCGQPFFSEALTIASEARDQDVGQLEWEEELLRIVEVESATSPSVKCSRLVAACGNSAVVMTPLPFGSEADGKTEHFHFPKGEAGLLFKLL